SPARFVAHIALADGSRILFEATGIVEGQIAPEPRGTHGFGYDPIFFYPPYGCTLGEVEGAKKAAVSHRGQAFRRLREWLASNPSPPAAIQRHMTTKFLAAACVAMALGGGGVQQNPRPATVQGTWRADYDHYWTRNSSERWISIQLRRDDGNGTNGMGVPERDVPALTD